MAQPVAGTVCGVDCPTGESKCYCCDENCDCTQTDSTPCPVGHIAYCDDDLDGELAVEAQCRFDEGIPVTNANLSVFVAFISFLTFLLQLLKSPQSFKLI